MTSHNSFSSFEAFHCLTDLIFVLFKDDDDGDERRSQISSVYTAELISFAVQKLG